jgi:hypothetical protein
MDENLEHKIRNLKLKVLRVEKELARTQHNVNLGAWLRAGHPGQLAKAGERDRVRLETKLFELRAELEKLAPGSTSKPAPPAEVKPVTPAPPPTPAQPEAEAITRPKPQAGAKSTKTVPAGKGKATKKAAVKKPAASESAKAKKKK